MMSKSIADRDRSAHGNGGESLRGENVREMMQINYFGGGCPEGSCSSHCPERCHRKVAQRACPVQVNVPKSLCKSESLAILS